MGHPFGPPGGVFTAWGLEQHRKANKAKDEPRIVTRMMHAKAKGSSKGGEHLESAAHYPSPTPSQPPCFSCMQLAFCDYFHFIIQELLPYCGRSAVGVMGVMGGRGAAQQAQRDRSGSVGLVRWARQWALSIPPTPSQPPCHRRPLRNKQKT